MPRWAVGGIAGVGDLAASLPPDVQLLVIVLFVGIFLGWFGIRWFVEQLRTYRGQEFQASVRGYDEIDVLMHPNPDPDAMSCALAARELAAAVGTSCTLQYPGQIRHQENRAFETVLDVNFDRIEGIEELQGDAVVLVDHNQARGFPGAETVEPVAVVDHHPGNGIGSDFTDVRTDHGSCASIFAEYFEDLDWSLADPEEYDNGSTAGAGTLSPFVATGLLYGIQSDTARLTKGCSTAEFQAAEYLYEGIDQDRLDRIANPQVDAEVLDVKARAITNRQVENAFAVSDVGTVSNVDAIPQAADELTRLEGITAVVVIGEKDGTLHVSGRSRDDRVHMGKVLESVVQDIPMSEAGGHARMGGGQISLEYMEGIGPSKGVPREDFQGMVFDAMAGDI